MILSISISRNINEEINNLTHFNLLPSVSLLFCAMQLAHNPITPSTSKLLFVQIQAASMGSSSSSWSRMTRSLRLSLCFSGPLGSMSHALVRLTTGWQIVLQAVGTSSALSSSAKVVGRKRASVVRKIAERIVSRVC